MAELLGVFVVALQGPVGRRRNHEMNGLVFEGRSGAGVSENQAVRGLETTDNRFDALHGTAIARELRDDAVEVALAGKLGHDGLFLAGATQSLRP